MTKRRKATVILSVLILAGAAGTALLLHMRNGGTELTADTDCLNDNIVYYYQKDSRWRDESLGASEYHMGDSGCLTSCLASAINMQETEIEGFDGEVDPGTLNSFFSENGVYDSEGNIQWGALEKASGAEIILKDASELEENEIQMLLEEGCYPVVRVKMPESGSGHFVLIVSCEDGGFICMDPLNEDLESVPLSHFNDTIYSVRYIQN